MRIVYVMDPMENVLPDKDTTYALQRATEARGHQSLHCLPHDVFIKDGRAFARCHEVTIEAHSPWFRMKSPSAVALDEVDCVFVRKDPPFDEAYLYLTLLLEVVRGKTLLLNDPAGLRSANEKLYALHFGAFAPRMVVSADRDVIHEFVRECSGEAVIKPLHGAGGAGVLRLREGDDNKRSIVDTLTREGKTLAMVQEYLPAVRQGDKRILLLDGAPLGAINRVPRSDDLRSNIHVGGRVEPTTISKNERAIISAIAPRLHADGLVFVGLDVIGEKLTEVNVTSPTGIQELSRHEGRDRATDVIAWIEQRAKAPK